MQPGIYNNIPNADYHGGQGISKSGLDLIAKSPAHFAAAKLEPREPTKAQALGTAIHALILEPDVFSAEYVPPLDKADFPDAFDKAQAVAAIKELNKGRLPKISVTGSKDELFSRVCDLDDRYKEMNPSDFTAQELKATIIEENDSRLPILKENGDLDSLIQALNENSVYCQSWDALQQGYYERAGDRIPLDTETWQQLHNMRDAVMAHPMARKVLTKAGKAEQSIYWIDEETGEACRCRPDYLTDCGIAVDLKSTNDASPDGFIKSIANFRYHVQAAMYEDGIRAVDHPFAVFVFIAVEKDACVINGKSKGVAVYTLDEASLIEGRLEYQANLKTYSECKKADVWPGYSESHTELTLPRWAMKNINSGE